MSTYGIGTVLGNSQQPLPADVTDRWTRQLGQVDKARVGGQVVGGALPDSGDYSNAVFRELVISLQAYFNPATTNNERRRTPTKFKGTTTTAVNNASTTIWTPAASTKYRLMGYRVQVSGNAALAAAALLQFRLVDSVGSDIFAGPGVHYCFLPAAAGTGPSLYDSGWILLPGNGFLGTAANSLLQLFCFGPAAALTSGQVTAMVCGCEE